MDNLSKSQTFITQIHRSMLKFCHFDIISYASAYLRKASRAGALSLYSIDSMVWDAYVSVLTQKTLTY